MEFWIHDHSTNTRTSLEADGDTLTLGRDDDCTIVLKSPFVARKHARLVRHGNQYALEATCRSGTRVANREIAPGQTVKLDFGDEIQIGPFSLAMVAARSADGTDAPAAHTQALQARLMHFEQQIHTQLLDRMNLRVTGRLDKQDAAFIQQIHHHLQTLLDQQIDTMDRPLLTHCLRIALERRVMTEVVRQCEGRVQTEYREADAHGSDPRLEQQLAQRVGSIVDLMPLLFDPLSVQDDLAVAEEAFDDLFIQELDALPNDLRRYIVGRTVAKDLLDIIFGLGPLQDLLAMPTVSEIMVVGRDNLYIEKQGVIQRTSRSFFSDDVLLSIIERILTPVGRRVDTSTPLVDARLPDGSRVNAVINPLSMVGPCLTIRKFGWMPFTIDDLIERQTVSEPVAAFLQGAIIGRQNIVISGGTGSGKTTLLNVLSGYCRPNERILTVEESAELRLPQPHVVAMEGRPANVEGRGAYTIRDLVRNALRMRPDRLIVGEVRGPEALDMLQAMNTGHDGSLSTVHANTPADAMKRLETLVLMAVDMPIRAIREQIISAVDLVVQVQRFASGQRRITAISEVLAIDPETQQIRLEDIFTLRDAEQPRLRHTGYLPTFTEHAITKKHFDINVFL